MRAWNSPGWTSLAATASRALAFFVPVPVLSANFGDDTIAFWFLLITLQSLTALAIGNLPTILMHMITHAKAADEDRQLTTVIASTHRIFGVATILYLGLALVLFTPLLWRQINVVSDFWGALGAWLVFIAGTMARIFALSPTTFLLGLNKVAVVRRAEAISWFAGGILAALGLLLYPNLVFAMVLLQAPAMVNFLVMRRLAAQYDWNYSIKLESGNHEFIRKEIVPRAVRGSIGIVAAYLMVYAGSIIYAQYGDSASIASFSFTVAIFGLISQLSVSHTLASLPAISRAYAAGETTRMNLIAARASLIGIILYAMLLAITFAGYQLAIHAFPGSFPSISLGLFLLFSIAYIPVRYASFHLHFYSATNDIRWHTYQIGTAVIYFMAVALLGANKPESYAIALLIANVLFAVPFARYLTFSKLNFVFSQERATLLIMFVSGTLLATALTAGAAIDAPAGLIERP